MLRRRRSQNNIPSSPSAGNTPLPPIPPPPAAPSAHRIRLVPHLEGRRNLKFEPVVRNLKVGDSPLKIGRFTDRSGLGLAAVNALSNNKLAFKSKVVSRSHAEISVEASEESGSNGIKFFVRDTKSSSGTFLNHLRLSPAGQESRKFELRDGDVLQLGVDYQGGAEDIYKSVKIRVEVGAGREWQAGRNAFNTNALNNLKSLASQQGLSAKAAEQAKPKKTATARTSLAGIPDCCICLFSISIRQALFITPCSHTFHYKCLRPLLEQHHPAFSCPLCRTYADLEEDVEIDPEDEESDIDDDGVGDEAGEDEDDPHLKEALAASAALVALSNQAGDITKIEDLDSPEPTNPFLTVFNTAPDAGGGTLINPPRAPFPPVREVEEKSDGEQRMNVDS